MRRRTRTYVGIVLLLGPLLVMVLTGCAELGGQLGGDPPAPPAPTPAATETPRPRGTAVGQEAPDFELPLVSGDKVKLSDYRGKVVLLNFWFVRCPACQWEAPHLVAAYERYRERGFTVLAVNMYDPLSTVRVFVERYGMAFPVLLDQQDLTARYHPRNLYPVTFILDREGVVAKSVVGAMDADTMSQLVEPLLGSEGG